MVGPLGLALSGRGGRGPLALAPLPARRGEAMAAARPGHGASGGAVPGKAVVSAAATAAGSTFPTTATISRDSGIAAAVAVEQREAAERGRRVRLGAPHGVRPQRLAEQPQRRARRRVAGPAPRPARRASGPALGRVQLLLRKGGTRQAVGDQREAAPEVLRQEVGAQPERARRGEPPGAPPSARSSAATSARRNGCACRDRAAPR